MIRRGEFEAHGIFYGLNHSKLDGVRGKIGNEGSRSRMY